MGDERSVVCQTATVGRREIRGDEFCPGSAAIVHVKMDAPPADLARPVKDLQFELLQAVVPGRLDINFAAEEVIKNAGAVLDGFGDEDGMVFLQNIGVINRQRHCHTWQVTFWWVLYSEIVQSTVVGYGNAGVDLGYVNALALLLVF